MSEIILVFCIYWCFSCLGWCNKWWREWKYFHLLGYRAAETIFIPWGWNTGRGVEIYFGFNCIKFLFYYKNLISLFKCMLCKFVSLFGTIFSAGIAVLFIKTLILKRLSVENKAKLSQLTRADFVTIVKLRH